MVHTYRWTPVLLLTSFRCEETTKGATPTAEQFSNIKYLNIMVQKFQNELYSLKNRVIEAIRNEVANKGGEIELSTEGNELTLDLSPLSLDYCARFEILGILDGLLQCKEVEADIYCSFGLNEIDVENLIFIYEQF